MSTDVLTERYGAPAPWRRRALQATAVVLVLAFAGWLTWSTLAHADAVVTSELETFDVQGQHSSTAVVVTTTAAGVEASCKVRAYAEDHSVVGEKTFAPTPGAGRRQQLEVRTEREATSVESLGCTAPGQNRPR